MALSRITRKISTRSSLSIITDAPATLAEISGRPASPETALDAVEARERIFVSDRGP
jgi:hypothetical protein